MDFSGKRVLITGGAGFIGSAIIERMLTGDVGRITAVDNLVRGRTCNLSGVTGDNRFAFIEGDVCDAELMAELVAGADILVHLAALRIKHCIAEPERAFDVMFRAPFEIFRQAADAGVEKVVLASSSSIYGQADAFPTVEGHHPYNDTTLYGAGKLANEAMLRACADMYGLRFTALRPFNVYGPRMDIHGAYTEVMVRWLERIEAGESPIIFGDGSQSMDFTFVDDVADAFVLAAGSDAANGHAFNVGTGVSTSLRALAELMLRTMGSDLAIDFQPAAAAAAVERRQADIGQAQRFLGYSPMVDLADGVARLVDWWRAETSRG